MAAGSLVRTLATSALALSLLLTGCRNVRQAVQEVNPFGGSSCACATEPSDDPVVCRVTSGDTLHGRLPEGGSCQCFFFDGVEYSLLDADLTSDGVPVRLALYDPDGRPVDLGCEDARSVRGLILRKTGTYKGVVCKAACEPESFYAFHHESRIVAHEDLAIELGCGETKPIALVAPRGARCIVTVRPKDKGALHPKIVAVEDPRGGRALDVARTLDGASIPWIREGRDGARVLDFNAATPGRYLVKIAAEPGTAGTAVASVQVFPPKPANRDLNHDGRPCPEATSPPRVTRQTASTR